MKNLHLLTLAALPVCSASAADLYWDANGATAGTGGTGTWNSVATTWRSDSATGTLQSWADGNTAVFGGSAGTVTLDGTFSPAEVIVNSADDFTFDGSGSITGPAGLTKSGGGTLTIANTHTFDGDTIVFGGSLVVNGTLDFSWVTVESGGTLAGTGTLAGPVTVKGVVAPGDSVGTLATGSLTLSGTYQCDIDGAQSDKIAVTGNLDLADSSLAVNFVNPPTGVNHVIASYTGSRFDTFEAAPDGYELDYTDPGKVVLWPASAPPPEGTITFEPDQNYPTAPGQIAATNGTTTNAEYDGTNGWSRSTSTSIAQTHATSSSGEYRGGQAIGAVGANTYIGGKLGEIQATGQNTITFDAPYFTGTGVGFLNDNDGNGLFDQGSGGANGDTGMAFGIGGPTGTPVRFQYRNANFGAENFGAGFTGIAGNWYRFTITIGDSVGGSRSITMAVRNLTTGVDFDFDDATEGTQDWTFSVTDAQFGTAPELSDGVFVRTTTSARVDNLRVTSVTPPDGTAYDSWMDGFPGLTGDDRLPDSDPDHDGIKNLLEFVLDGDPTLSDPSILPAGGSSGGNLVFTFQRRDDSEGLVNPTVQYGTDLGTWTDVVIGDGDGSSGGATYTVAENGDLPDLITVTIPTGGDPKKFARLRVEEAP